MSAAGIDQQIAHAAALAESLTDMLGVVNADVVVYPVDLLDCMASGMLALHHSPTEAAKAHQALLSRGMTS